VTGSSLHLPAELVDQLADEVAVRARAILDENGGGDRWLTLKSAAEYLDCSPRRLYEFVRRDSIPHERDGRRILFLRSELDAWVRRGGAKTLAGSG